jgi:hypothetical protein
VRAACAERRREVSISRVARDLCGGDRRAANAALRAGDARARLVAHLGLAPGATMRSIVLASTEAWDGSDSALRAIGRAAWGGVS